MSMRISTKLSSYPNEKEETSGKKDQTNDPETMYSLEGYPEPYISFVSIKDGYLSNEKILDFSSHPSVVKRFSDVAKSVGRFFSKLFDINVKVPQVFIKWDKAKTSWICQNTTVEGEEQCTLNFKDKDRLPSNVFMHVYMHGVIKAHKQFQPSEQTEALKEHLADVFSIAFMHWEDPSTKNDWTIMDRNISITTHFRNMKNENTRYLNSLIPSHAFYLAVINSKAESFGIIAQIWLIALKTLQSPNVIFKAFAKETVTAAKKNTVLFFNSKLDIPQIIRDAWYRVGIKLDPLFSKKPK